MGRGKHLTYKEKQKIITKSVIGKNGLDIAKEIERSKTPVYNVLQANEERIGNNREKFLQLCAENNIDYRLIINKVNELINANKHQLQPDGLIELVPDNITRAKVLQYVINIFGLDAPKEIKQDISLKLNENETKEISLIKERYKLINN